ncbi:MAG: NifU family protein [Actinobacteria bacterium]|nr:NifU family protein [Actinomycetota bacterium]
MREVTVPGPVRIRADVSEADPHTCRFVCSEVVHPDGPYAFTSPEEAAGSPLPEHLFDLGVVTHVLIAETVVTVSIRPDVEWGDLRKRIGAIIRAQADAGVPAVLASVPNLDGWVDGATRDTAALRRILDHLFEHEVNPRVASHGGRIEIVEVGDTTLKISMHGGCQGCSSSNVTIEAGVEVMVRRVAPEITEIIDVTDHARGASPYRSGPVRLVPVDQTTE